MAFADITPPPPGIALLQRSLERGRLGHAYLFSGERLNDLERIARTLAKTLNCRNPRRAASGAAIDCCDTCPSCRKIDGDLHADVRWLRPEAKSRVIVVDQIRELLEAVYLKPTEAEHKVAVLVAADRLTTQAANAFLKTLEEPPPRSVLLLLSTEPQRLLETILSRCLRLNFGGGAAPVSDPETAAWLAGFVEQVAAAQGGLLSRYRLLAQLLAELGKRRDAISRELTGRSPLERYEDADPELRERWEEELEAAIEAEYRRQRTECLAAVQWWLRDVWLATQNLDCDRLSLPQLAAATRQVAARVSPSAAAENLRTLERTQRLLFGNVQEALALEVGLVKLQL